MTIKKLAKLLTAREGLKKQVSIADMAEILGHLSDMIFEDEERHTGIYDVLLINGCKRAALKASTVEKK